MRTFPIDKVYTVRYAQKEIRRSFFSNEAMVLPLFCCLLRDDPGYFSVSEGPLGRHDATPDGPAW